MKSHVVAVVGALLAVGLSSESGVRAQQGPPIGGTMALEGTMEKFYKGTNFVVVKTIDGVEHVFQFTENLILHGGKGPGPDALPGLEEGRTVIVHYSTSGTRATAHEIDEVGDDGLRISEGTVVHISRSRKEIVIRFGNGVVETLRLTDRAAAEAGADLDAAGAVQVKVFFVDESRQKVVHYFQLVESKPAKKD